MKNIKKNYMKLEIEKIKKRKILKDQIWNEYELKQLENLLKNNKFRECMINNIFSFKLYKLKNWSARYKRIRKKPNITTKYTMLLRYGKEETIIRYNIYTKNLKYYLSKEYLIEKYGLELGNIKYLNRGKAFRDPSIQRANSLKCAKNKKENPELYKNITPNQINYWVKRGYSIDESKLKVSEFQKMFSLEICIEKYGENDGKEVFNKRQEKWLNTLNNKTEEEKLDINLRKNPCIKRSGESKEHFLDRLSGIGTNIIFDNEDLIKYINTSLLDIKWKYLNKKEFLKNLPYIGNATLDVNKYLDEIGFIFPEKNLIRNARGNTYLKIDEGVLRSFFEIEFYEGLKERNIRFKLDKSYDNSNLKYDFYLIDYDIYIEIAGSMYDEEYANKMYYKNIMFGAYIVKPEEIQDFLKRIDNEFKQINCDV